MGRRKRRRQELKPSCAAVAADMARLRDLAGDHGLRVTTSEMKGKRWKGLHVMFDDAAGRVMDYWPTNVTWWSERLLGARGKADDVWAALDLAAAIGASSFSPQVAETQPEGGIATLPKMTRHS